METIWDWLTVFAFAGLVTLMLQRSSEEVPRDSLIQYLPAAGGCAVINYLGNEGMVLAAVLLSIVTFAYVLIILKPRPPSWPGPK
ncbi:XrtV sorting system accessory protein [Erythrobacter sp.]|uniref:XrtV sorting system accessory protein n=1 Tax=Erythrobacter sp. TaxID=1042 RepID=UPI00345D6307